MSRIAPTVIESRIDRWYDESSKGDDWRFCSGCTAHIHTDDLWDAEGFCPGCERMEEAQQGRRGAL